MFLEVKTRSKQSVEDSTHIPGRGRCKFFLVCLFLTVLFLALFYTAQAPHEGICEGKVFGFVHKRLFATSVNVTRTLPNLDIYLYVPTRAFIKAQPANRWF